MSANNSLPRDRSLKRAVLCASFDRKVRAEIMNERESARLEKHHRSIEVSKSSIAKEHVAEKNRVTSRMQNLRKAVVCRSQSIDSVSSATSLGLNDATDVHLPKLQKLVANSRNMDLNSSAPNIHLFYEENEQKSTSLPMITLNSPQSERKFKLREHKICTIVPRSRTQSHGDLRSDERMMAEDINSNVKRSLERITHTTEKDKRLEDDSGRKEFLDIKCFQRNSRFASRRRSLSTGDVTLAERINSFLESVENCRVSSDSLDYNSSNSEEERDAV